MDLIVALVLLLLLLAVSVGCLLGERSARHRAWQRIHQERRSRPPEA